MVAQTTQVHEKEKPSPGAHQNSAKDVDISDGVADEHKQEATILLTFDLLGNEVARTSADKLFPSLFEVWDEQQEKRLAKTATYEDALNLKEGIEDYTDTKIRISLGRDHAKWKQYQQYKRNKIY